VRRIWGAEHPHPVLPPPTEKQVRVDAVLEGQLRDRHRWIARRRGQSTLEFDRVIRTSLPRRPLRARRRRHNGPHQDLVGTTLATHPAVSKTASA
jgi:hypothetical protein